LKFNLQLYNIDNSNLHPQLNINISFILFHCLYRKELDLEQPWFRG